MLPRRGRSVAVTEQRRALVIFPLLGHVGGSKNKRTWETL